MNTKVTYRIASERRGITYIEEYWDDIRVYKWRVHAIYHGGDIIEFMEKIKLLEYLILMESMNIIEELLF